MKTRRLSQIQKLQVYGALSTVAVLAFAAKVNAYPEFQQFVETHSGKSVNCALCHQNGNGPSGKEEGQVGSLNEKELAALNSARGAIEPGMLKADSPILNKFGNSIMRSIGKKKFLELREKPEQLAEVLDKKSDIDEDGIPDGQEYLDGTDPSNKNHGDPLKLFAVNIDRYKSHLILAGLAVVFLDWGFAHLIMGFYRKSQAKKLKRRETT